MEKTLQKKKGERLKLISGGQASKSQIKQICAMEKSAFNFSEESFSDEEYERFLVNPDTYIILVDVHNDSVAGYVDVTPSSWDVLRKIKARTFDELDPPEDTILAPGTKGVCLYYMYSFNMVPEWQGTSAFARLALAIIQKIFQGNKEGLLCGGIASFPVTERGMDLCSWMGMKPVNKVSGMYHYYYIPMLPSYFEKKGALYAKLKKYCEENIETLEAGIPEEFQNI